MAHPEPVLNSALKYLDTIKATFRKEPVKYNEFLDIMKGFKQQELDTPGVVERVKTLFGNHTSLLLGFNDFLPPGYYVDASGTLVRPNGTDQGIGRQLDRLATSVLYLNATISQDETNGRSQKKLQRLEEFFQMISAENTMRRGNAKQITVVDAVPKALRHTDVELSNMSIANTLEELDVNYDIQATDSLNDERNESESDEYELSSEEEYNSEESLHDNKSAGNNDLHGIFPPKGIRRPWKLTNTLSAESTDSIRAKKSVEEASNGDDASDLLNDADLATYAEFTSEDICNEKTRNQHQTPQNITQWVQDFSKMMDETLTVQMDQLARLSKMTMANNSDQLTSDKILETLQNSTKHLKLQLQTNKNLLQPSLMVFHSVFCSERQYTKTTTDEPVYTERTGHKHLEGYLLVSDPHEYMTRQRPECGFYVVRTYHCNHSHVSTAPKGIRTSLRQRQKPNGPFWLSEEVWILSDSLCDQIKEVAKGSSRLEGKLMNFSCESPLQAPYFFYYHDRQLFRNVLETGKTESSKLGRLLMYIEDTMSSEYDAVSTYISKGQITPEYLPYLFHPQAILVSKNAKKPLHQIEVYLQTSTIERLSKAPSETIDIVWRVVADLWVFDGEFRKKVCSLDPTYNKPEDAEMRIQDLEIYPLEHAHESVRSMIRRRGELFWSSRKQRYVSYSGMDYAGEQSYTDARFMIDFSMYQKMHRAKDITNKQNEDIDVGSEMLAKEVPPDDNFLLLLPSNIYGFNMQEKKWGIFVRFERIIQRLTSRTENIQTNLIRPVDWNKESFESLVIDADTKELIIALITNKIDVERGTDMMVNKGNGLIILLHGGPGTGKTLTAESVAEIAEKPLYRVTCGDIGTNPSEVEKYLETVMELGKMWKCVVLLDEADVFLEQRTLSDLQRNALVSVFLRVLEYYDGILILTSNRVGTFDEAFKSRIQLALHYENLTRKQRTQIWKNFIERLAKTESSSVDTDGLLAHVEELAALEMNGRQIRNALTTARQLALFKRVKMSYNHLKHVIKVAGKFETYLSDIAGVTDDEIARDKGLR